MDKKNIRILITGTNGYIGNFLYQELKSIYQVDSITRKDVNLTNSIEVHNFFQNKYYDTVIHCAIEGGHRLVKDTTKVLDNNLKMYYNLLECKSHYNKFISFGSGAEIYSIDEPYGMSKNVISKSIFDKNSFYNIRLYGIFDENELDSRFIKSNIIRYINKEPMEVHQNKFMDFFYIKDLLRVVDYYISSTNPIPKEYECSYYSILPHSLLDIANLINNLSDYKVDISLNKNKWGIDYISKTKKELPVPFLGLEEGIKQVYNKLK
jgi:nucleoside-diphosphate-sugar epimerase